MELIVSFQGWGVKVKCSNIGKHLVSTWTEVWTVYARTLEGVLPTGSSGPVLWWDSLQEMETPSGAKKRARLREAHGLGRGGRLFYTGGLNNQNCRAEYLSI